MQCMSRALIIRFFFRLSRVSKVTCLSHRTAGGGGRGVVVAVPRYLGSGREEGSPTRTEQII